MQLYIYIILSIIYIIITQVTDTQLSCQEYYNRISLMIKNYIYRRKGI